MLCSLAPSICDPNPQLCFSRSIIKIVIFNQNVLLQTCISCLCLIRLILSIIHISGNHNNNQFRVIK